MHDLGGSFPLPDSESYARATQVLLPDALFAQSFKSIVCLAEHEGMVPTAWYWCALLCSALLTPIALQSPSRRVSSSLVCSFGRIQKAPVSP